MRQELRYKRFAWDDGFIAIPLDAIKVKTWMRRYNSVEVGYKVSIILTDGKDFTIDIPEEVHQRIKEWLKSLDDS